MKMLELILEKNMNQWEEFGLEVKDSFKRLYKDREVDTSNDIGDQLWHTMSAIIDDIDVALNNKSVNRWNEIGNDIKDLWNSMFKKPYKDRVPEEVLDTIDVLVQDLKLVLNGTYNQR